MLRKIALPVILAASLVPLSAQAEKDDIFAGLGLSTGIARGSSNQTDGGAAGVGGGIVENIKFGNARGFGGHVGYRLSPAWSTFASYQHLRGDVSWDARFPAINAISSFAGKATSNLILANLGYDLPISDSTAFTAGLGLGASFNSLSNVVEINQPGNSFLSDVGDNTQISPAAQISIGLEHKIMPHALLKLDATFAYTGGFETASTRTGNLGTTPITAYEINHVWRTGIGASLRLAF